MLRPTVEVADVIYRERDDGEERRRSRRLGELGMDLVACFSCLADFSPILLYLEQQLTPMQWFWAVTLASFLACVHILGFWGLPLRDTHLRARVRYGVLYVVALAVLTGFLVSIHPTFYFVLSGFFSQTFYALPPPWAIPFVSTATF